MRSHNYYAAPGFERAGLRRRDMAWITAQAADAASVFIPVWRNQSLVVEVEGAEPRAALLSAGGISVLPTHADDAESLLAHGAIVFLGVIGERPHFAVDVSHHDEAPLDALRSPVLASCGIDDAVCALPICANSPAGWRGMRARCWPLPGRCCFGIRVIAFAGCAASRRAAKRPASCGAAPTPPAT